MKKAIILIFTLIFVCLCFASCKDDGIPDGMKLASDTSRVPYSLFVPQDWILDSSTDIISSAHASESDRTSINIQGQSFSSLDAWWDNYKHALSNIFTDIQIQKENEDIQVGGLNAKRHIITGSFGQESYIMYELIGVIKDNTTYVFTISYPGTKKDDKITYTNDTHAESIKKILDNFKFNDKLTDKDDTVYEVKNTPEGMKPASNNDIVDYNLFVPSDWVVEVTNGTVSSAYVSEGDKTNVSVMQWNVGSYDYNSWWESEYKLQLYNALDKNAIVLDDKGQAKVDENGKISYLPSDIISFKEEGLDAKLGENDAKKYTFSAKIGEGRYDYQVISSMHRSSIYVMTFTFKSGCDMSLYQSDVDKIISSFRFN